MNKEIEIPEGYEARIEGNKVILEKKESEDEGIRKFIIDCIDELRKANAENAKFNGRCSDAIAYLEQQKESTWTDEDESFVKHILPRILNPDKWTMEQVESDRERLKEFIDRQKCKWLEKQKEQKVSVTTEWPNLSNCPKNCKKCLAKCFYRKEAYEEQKPASTVKSKFKSGDSIRFNGFGSNEYTIQLVGNGYYVNSEGGRMDMSYTDANFVLIENAQKEHKPIKVYDNMDDLIADAMIDEISKSDMLDRDKHNRIYWINKHRQKPAEWSEDYREEDLRTRFAFYTYKDEDGVLYLSNVFVEETSRNKGFGTKILLAAEKVAETIGATIIRLKVKQDSPANTWYRKHGYGYMAYEDGYDWLEKSLEYMKPVKSAEWSEEDEKMLWEFTAWIPEGELAKHNITRNDILEKLKSLRPQLKQGWSEEDIKKIRSEEYTKGFNDAAFGGKLKEWSEEDEAAHTRILGAVAKAFMGVLPTKPSEKDVHWLKTLPERFNLQPKQEWSEEEKERIRQNGRLDVCYNPEKYGLCHKTEWGEEDKNFIKELCNLLASIAKNNHVGCYYAPDLVSKLQSLHPHWKPSEEQIEYLAKAVKTLSEEGDNKTASVLNELRLNLKKL